MTDRTGAGPWRSGGGWRWLLWGGAALLLAAPFVASRFTTEVNWDLADYLIFGAMLAVAGLAGELLARLTRRPAWRLVGALAIGAAFLLVWAQLAVGVL